MTKIDQPPSSHDWFFVAGSLVLLTILAVATVAAIDGIALAFGVAQSIFQ